MKERWRKTTRGGGVAELRVPPDAHKVRTVEVYCRFVVALKTETPATHGMSVYANGALQWSRRIETHNPGATDTLDHRFSRELSVGEPLRVTVNAEAIGCVPLHIDIEVEEE
jgi:hypothetical protein